MRTEMIREARSKLGMFAFAIGIIVAAALHAAPPEGSVNIVLIYADDLGWSDLGCYGNTYHQTPNIDALVQSGMRFTQAYSDAPLCAPSRVALLSGRSSVRQGCFEVIDGRYLNEVDPEEMKVMPPENHLRLPSDTPTLAELLRQNGYRCGLFGKWHVGSEQPSERGFGDYVVLKNGSHWDASMSFLRQSGGYPAAQGYSSDYLNRCALQFLDKPSDEPFFLFLSHTLVHTAMGPGTEPLEPKPDLLKKYQALSKSKAHSNPAYAAMVEALDQSTGELVQALRERGLMENTLVIFSSDNGGLLGGSSGQTAEGLPLGRITSNLPLRNGKATLWDGGIRVPLAFSFPGKIPAGSVSDEVVSQLDFLPTFLDFAGLKPIAEQAKPDGMSLVPLLTGDVSGLPERTLFWHYPNYRLGGAKNQRPAGAIRSGDWKLVESLEDGSVQLFNLTEDISELHDLNAQYPEKAQSLKAELKAWQNETGAPMPGPIEKRMKAAVPAAALAAAGVAKTVEFSKEEGFRDKSLASQNGWKAFYKSYQIQNAATGGQLMLTADEADKRAIASDTMPAGASTYTVTAFLRMDVMPAAPEKDAPFFGLELDVADGDWSFDGVRLMMIRMKKDGLYRLASMSKTPGQYKASPVFSGAAAGIPAEVGLSPLLKLTLTLQRGESDTEWNVIGALAKADASEPVVQFSAEKVRVVPEFSGSPLSVAFNSMTIQEAGLSGVVIESIESAAK